MRRIIINAARVGRAGGLREFAVSFSECFRGSENVVAVVPDGAGLPQWMAQVNLPGWVGSSSKVSALKPLFWWLYSAVRFPKKQEDLVLSTTHHVLPSCKRQVVTVHDVRPYYYPDSVSQKINFHYMMPRALKKCDGILTVSETSKHLISKIYGIDAGRIHVVPNTIDAAFLGKEREPEPAEPFLLSVGASWKHKNVAEVIEMHSHWSSKYRLKIVAGQGQYLESLKALAASNGISNRVDFVSGIPKDELLHLYSSCSALVYPSLMEGFGLPPLEAMAIGVPVIVSDIDVFRELYGDVPIYVRLKDATSWRRAFEELTTLSQTRLDQGKATARSFSQERMKRALFSALAGIWGSAFTETVGK